MKTLRALNIQNNSLVVSLMLAQRALPESAYVGPVPMIRSLAPSHAMPEESLVLTLSWEGAHLYRNADEKLEELSDGAFPVTFSQLIAPRDPEAQLQYRSHASSGDGSGQQVAVYHGQGDGEGKIEADRTNYLARLGDLVAREIYNRDVCLVMVGTEEVLGEFESVCDVEPTLRVHVSPDGLDRNGLAERVQAGMRDYLSQLQSELSQQCSDADSAGHFTTDSSQIVAAALQGRIKCLLYRDDAKLLGSVDAETMGMQPADGEDAMDLVNLAAVHTLRNGGEIYRIQAEETLVESMAAILRY
ncbi:MAG: hypothetical protein NXI32_25400 [bacterium]|nr:hypothetical protein [bacterium]